LFCQYDVILEPHGVAQVTDFEVRGFGDLRCNLFLNHKNIYKQESISRFVTIQFRVAINKIIQKNNIRLAKSLPKELHSYYSRIFS